MHKAPALAHRPRTEHALAAGGALVRALSLALALAPAYVLVLVLFLLLLRFLRNRFPIRPQHHDLIVLRLRARFLGNACRRLHARASLTQLRGMLAAVAL